MNDNVFDKGLLNGKFVSMEKIYELMEKEESKVYEVIRVINGKPLFFEEHVDRLNNSIKLIELDLKCRKSDIMLLIDMLINEQGLKNNNIKITFCKIEDKSYVAAYYIKSYYPDETKIREGYKAILVYEERKNPNAKILNNELRDLINSMLKEEQADECIYVSEKGEVLEGSRTNIFFVKGNSVLTSPDNDVLLGTTRNKIMEICYKKRIVLHKKNIRVEDLPLFDAAFVTGTSIDVMPVNSIGTVYYNSSENRIVENIMKEYNKEKLMYLSEFKI
jgi:branched-chain amino acid aminotransferase